MGEKRGGLVIDTLVVSVQPVDLLLRHERAVDERSVVETKGECLKSVPLVVGRGCGCGLGRNDGNQILRADSPFTCAVDTRFVGDDVTDLQWSGVVVRAHVLRSFVATEENVRRRGLFRGRT